VIKNKTHGTAGNEVHMVRFANANAFCKLLLSAKR